MFGYRNDSAMTCYVGETITAMVAVVKVHLFARVDRIAVSQNPKILGLFCAAQFHLP